MGAIDAVRIYEPEGEKAVIKNMKEPGGHYLTTETIDLSSFQEDFVYDEGNAPCKPKFHDTYIEERARAVSSIDKRIDSRPYDENFVYEMYKGKGFGKAIVKWALLRCDNKGWNPSLCVVTGNIPAKCLYEQCGFNVAQTLEMNRIFSKNKTPDYRGPVGG